MENNKISVCGFITPIVLTWVWLGCEGTLILYNSFSCFDILTMCDSLSISVSLRVQIQIHSLDGKWGVFNNITTTREWFKSVVSPISIAKILLMQDGGAKNTIQILKEMCCRIRNLSVGCCKLHVVIMFSSGNKFLILHNAQKQQVDCLDPQKGSRVMFESVLPYRILFEKYFKMVKNRMSYSCVIKVN